ncbi:MAG TPA: rod shape-determining protein MreD [Candidatus Moranbacteria bacterium]|nr:rod shape-determining protein MreD [Candidatus Moranbacteria bacterium]
MFNKAVIFSLIFIAVILQSSFLPIFFPPETIPDLALILIIIWTIRNGFEKTVGRSILAGFMLDLVYFWPVGISIITFVTISFITSFLAKRFLISQRSWRLFIIVCFVVLGTLINQTILVVFAKILTYLKEETLFSPFFGISSFFKIVSNIVLLFIIYLPIKKIESFLDMYTQKAPQQGRFFQR